jgi:hypothetical protein
MGGALELGEFDNRGGLVMTAPVTYAPPATPAWHDLHRCVLTLLQQFADDCDAAGVDALPWDELTLCPGTN